jgi:hypothetical protein
MARLKGSSRTQACRTGEFPDTSHSPFVAIIGPMLAALFACTVLWQDPRPADKRPAPPAAKEASAEKGKDAGKALDDKSAKAVLDAWNKAKNSSKFEDRLQALDQFGTGRHKTIVPALTTIAGTDKSPLLQKRAVELLVDQTPAEALAAIKKLLKNPKVTDPMVLAELVRGIQRCGYDKTCWADIEPLFERSYAQECLPLHEAILELAKVCREKQALPLLLRNFDEPKPADVDAADNPPADYWEARWKAWQAWRPRVADALEAITGQKFENAEAAKLWLKKNPPK